MKDQNNSDGCTICHTFAELKKTLDDFTEEELCQPIKMTIDPPGLEYYCIEIDEQKNPSGAKTANIKAVQPVGNP